MPPLDRIKEILGAKVLEAQVFRGDGTIVVAAAGVAEVLLTLKESDGLDFDFLVDLAGVDRKSPVEQRFEVVYHLYSTKHNHRLRVRVRLPELNPVLPSITPLWKGADWYEREAWEMFGITFAGHPNLKRLLTFEGFEGYPLRKDYPIAKRQQIPESLKEI